MRASNQEGVTAGNRGAIWMAVCAATVCLVGLLPVLAANAVGRTALHDIGLREGHADVDHVYRLVGKVRLLFFWMSDDDVGGARITWRGDDQHHAVSLLIGSEPHRAPREINEWGYLREDVAADRTTVFGIRTVTDGESPDAAETQRPQSGEMAELGVVCSTVSSLDAESRITTAHVPRDATYREVSRVLDAVQRNARWRRQHTPRPDGVVPGFLTALDLMMRSSADAARGSDAAPTRPQVAYVYGDAVYDLVPRRLERVPQLRTASGVFRNLLRADIVARNRSTRSTTSFSVTYGTEGTLTGIPVAARYQPNWWFKMELELDKDQDVPPDPADDGKLRDRISALCSPQ